MIGKCESIVKVPASPITFEQMSIIVNSQRLWQQLAYWLRSLIISALRDPERLPSNLDRLYTGTTREYYNYFRLLYGPEVAQYILDIVSGTVINILNIVDGYKNNDVNKINSNALQLYERADVFSSYMSRINSNWSELQWKSYLYKFIKLLLEQIVAMAGGRFHDEIVIADRLEDLAVAMGNYMARGLIGSISGQLPL